MGILEEMGANSVKNWEIGLIRRKYLQPGENRSLK
jgi:hypothetical protein